MNKNDLQIEFIYQYVFEALGVNDKLEVCHEIRADLEEGLSREMIVQIWANLSEDQADHLQEHVGQEAVMEQGLSRDEKLVDFAMMYPELMEKVYKGLKKFLDKYIEEFLKR